VSFDPPGENRAFRAGSAFPFRLLSDTGKVAGAAYDTVKAADERNPTMARRITYLIDPAGVVRRVYRVSDVSGHADEVLRDLAELSAG
jgi:peroxiredoxin Q/BCP